jgi:non-ribosomal peptide synthetase component F
VREVTLGAYAHQDVPFHKVVAARWPERTLNRNPFFQVMLQLQNVPLREVELRGLSVSQIPVTSATSKFDLSLSLAKVAGGLKGRQEYSTELFESATIDRILRDYGPPGDGGYGSER